MKRALLRVANAVLHPLGVQLYKNGMDMESVLRQMSGVAGDVRTVIDIGASNGRWSRSTMRFFPRARFIAIDPLQEREPDLRRLKQRNSRFDYILCVAGEADNGSVELAVSDDLDGSTVGGSLGKKRQVPSYSIDRIVEMKQCEGPFLLKFDTHGFEVPILKGATNTLKNTSHVVMEVYNYRHTEATLLFHEMCALLDEMGFRCFNVADPMQRPLDKSLWQMDLFFARKDNALFRDSSYRAKS
jgi:FkbM family methyltransferase